MIKSLNRFRAVFVPFFISAVFIACLALVSLAQQTVPEAYSKLEPCSVGGYKGKAFCGELRVYEDREKASGRKIPLKIVLLPATGENRKPDPLFLFAGGPGQASTDGAASNAIRYASILAERDLVMVDQRGTGGSNGLSCDLGGLKGAVDAFVAGDFSTAKVRECRDRLTATADPRFYSTPNAVDDIEEVRRWLGYETINIYGGSYGTRPAMVYLRRHPESVRTVTVRGVYSIDPRYFARDTGNALELVFNDCEASAECRKNYPNLRETFEDVLKRLSKAPAVYKTGTKEVPELIVDTDMFLGGIRRLLYDTSTQQKIPLMIHKASVGNFQPFDDIVRDARGLLSSFSVGMFFSVACPEGIVQGGSGAERVIPEQKYFGSFMIRGATAACNEWGLKRLPEPYFEPIASDKPVLLLSGSLDPVTPPVWAQIVAKSLPNSLQLTMQGIAHGPFPDCAGKIMSEFIGKGSEKGLDTACLSALSRPEFYGLPVFEDFNSPGMEGAALELAKAEFDWLKMSGMADRASLEALLPDEFKQTEVENGQIETSDKTAWIGNVVGLLGSIENGRFRLGDPKVTIDGDQATVDVSWSVKGGFRGRSLESTINLTDVWKRVDGEWKPISRKIN